MRAKDSTLVLADFGSMGDFIRSKLRTKLFRKSSVTTSPAASSPASSPPEHPQQTVTQFDEGIGVFGNKGGTSVAESRHNDDQPPSPTTVDGDGQAHRSENVTFSNQPTLQNSDHTLPTLPDQANDPPKLTLERPTPRSSLPTSQLLVESPPDLDQHTDLPASDKFTTNAQRFEVGQLRKQSLVDSSNAHIIQALLQGDIPATAAQKGDRQQEYFTPSAAPLHPGMLQRKIWVKRPGASATRVQVREDDLVDDVRDYIVRKYGNSLGRNFDSPDLIIKIIPRPESGQRAVEKLLSPEEDICKAIDSAFPNGQGMDEALVIDIPHRRTPKPSPRAQYLHYYEETARPLENGGDYFPPMPPPIPSPGAATTSSHHGSVHNGHSHHHDHPQRAMSVLTTGHVPSIPHPPLPSPGGRRGTGHHSSRPKYNRQHTSSPTAQNAPNSAISKQRPHRDSAASERHLGAPALLPTPPAQNPDGTMIAPMAGLNGINPPLPGSPRVSSPGPRRQKKVRKPPQEQPAPSIAPTLGLDTSVPPINVLIVEDNHINMKLLEQFIRRLKVRWATAVNGREAVNKWREGGFHLVLMDIQLPIMSGLEATREIRRLERVNSIGVFGGNSSASSEAPTLSRGSSAMTVPRPEDPDREEAKEEDKLDVERLFKSPVIIVALTASALQSDRHEALTAGCNDFLTKPVNFVWFERKVKEWGCMQALIDFDGWRKWKDFADTSTANGTTLKGKAAGGIGAGKKAAKLKAGVDKAVESGGEHSTSS